MRNSLHLVLILCTSIFSPVFSETNICYLQPETSTNPASLKYGDNVNIDFSYETDEASGVRIFIRPFTAGNLTPGYSASGSPVYNGSGSDVAYFTLSGSGLTVVDELRVQVFNADQSVLLLEFYVPYEFRFSPNAVKNIQFASGSSGSFLHGHPFSLSFDYDIGQPGGARVFFRPMSGGYLTPDYSASGSGLYTGTGSQLVNFTINSGLDVTVDQVRVQVLNSDQSVILDEFYIPVYLKFSNVEIRNINAPGSIYFSNNDPVDFTFDYETTQSDGVRIFVRPFSDNNLTPNYAASGSPVYAMGSGSIGANYTVTSGNTIVDQSRIQVYNSDQSQLLLEYFIPADYVTGAFDFYNFRSCAPSPARLANGTDIDMEFVYSNMTGADARMFIRPFTAGALSPNYAASGSPNYAAGSSGAGSGYFTITSGNVIVDNLRVLVTDASQTNTIMEFYIPVHYVFGAPAVSVDDVANQVSEFRIAPNPSGGTASLSYRLNQTQEVAFALYDLYGRQLRTLGTQQAVEGETQTLPLDAGALSNGIYVLKMSGKNIDTTQKWVVAKE